MQLINSRHDLDSIAGTPAHAAFIAGLKGSLTRTTDVQVYPEGYDRTLKEGAEGYLAPILAQTPDDTTAARYGYTREQLLAL